MKCQECGEDTMYDQMDGKKCALCGWKWEPTTGHIEDRPTKPHNAVCGELVTEYPNYDKTYPRMIKGLCNDGSSCSFNPTGMKQLEDGRWIAVCTTHDK